MPLVSEVPTPPADFVRLSRLLRRGLVGACALLWLAGLAVGVPMLATTLAFLVVVGGLVAYAVGLAGLAVVLSLRAETSMREARGAARL